MSLLKDLAMKALFEGIITELVNCPQYHSSEIAVQEDEEEDDSFPPAEKKRKMEQTVDASSSS